MILMRPEVAGKNRITRSKPKFLSCPVDCLRRGASGKKLWTGRGIHYFYSPLVAAVSPRDILPCEFRERKNQVRRSDRSTECEVAPRPLGRLKKIRIRQMLKIGKAGSNLEGAVCIVDMKLIGVQIDDPIRPDLLDSPALVGCPGSIFRAGKIVARHIVWQGSADLLKIKGRQTNVDRKPWISGECAREAKKISNDPSAGVGLQDPCTKIDYQCPRLGFLVLTGKPSLLPASMRNPSPAQLHNSRTFFSASLGN